MMKRLLTFVLGLLMTTGMMAQGWPENYPGVMLQGFYWDGYADAQWIKLESQADDLATTFNLVWIPQSGNCGGKSMGYDDLYWFPGSGHYNSSFGTESQLKSLISTFKEKGIGTIADVVINHRRNVSNWVDFPQETYKGEKYKLESTDICANDDGGKTKTWATTNGYSLSANNDTGEGWDGMRDLDHKSENVQRSVKAYLKMLLEYFGYTGFRYDMVKGYSGSYTKMYNEDARPAFSVGECWDGTNTIRSWIDATGKTSAAFDFQFRYVVRNAANGQNWNLLDQQNDNNWPLVSDKYRSGSYRRYAVTFVENHDTEYRSASAPQDPLKKDTLAANAYMLAMPGTPCVFQKHWLAYKQEIANMVAVRKAVGIHSMSAPTKKAANQNYYAVEVEGSDGKKLLCVVGKNAATYTPEGDWKKAISGYHYVYYVQGIDPSSITYPEIKDQSGKDGEYAGVPSFCTVTPGEICAFFEAPASWGTLAYTWAWMNGGDGKDYLGKEWPGVSAKLLGTADNGNRVFKWTSTKTTAPDNIIFSASGHQTDNLKFTNCGYYCSDGFKEVVSKTTGIESLTSDPSPKGEGSGYYTLDGRRLQDKPTAKGLYIVNGRKVVIK